MSVGVVRAEPVVTVADWLRVRTAVADVVRKGSPRSQAQTAIAEALMTAGVIDVQAVLDRIDAEIVDAEVVEDDE